MKPWTKRLALLSGLLFAACARSEAAPLGPPPPEVTVAPVVEKELRDAEEFTGRLEAVDSVEIRPRVSGHIDSVHFAPGERVKKGQLLFRIDARPFQAEARRLQANVQSARSQLEFANVTHERGQRLLAERVISAEAVDKVKNDAASAEAALAASRAALETARLNLDFTAVRSPIAGRISRALITPGNLVSSSSLLTTVVSDDPVYASFDADEHSYLRFRKSADGKAARPVFMGLVDEPGYPHEGHLEFVDNQVDPRTGTIRARALFPNGDGRFTPGLFARIKLVGAESRKTLLIADHAVGTDLGKKFAYVLGPDNTVQYRLITLGSSAFGLRIVKTGLKAGDQIVTQGLQRVRPGMKVVPTTARMASR
ncbi:MAG TPA: efflux RND transporter periplasmic adaptor subunit [Polyangiaceae bacterium]|nr:efflux RND transporter periplasmic adaptor subunit [Polyangiaceae bacterium]